MDLIRLYFLVSWRMAKIKVTSVEIVHALLKNIQLDIFILLWILSIWKVNHYLQLLNMIENFKVA